MKKILFLVAGFTLFSILIPQIAYAGMYGEVYIPEHEFIGFYDETETYTIFAGIKNKEGKLTKDDKNSANYWSRTINW